MVKVQRDNGKRKAELEQLARDQRVDDTSRLKRHPREVSWHEGDQPSTNAPRKEKAYRKDAPRDYDQELGLVRDWEGEPEPAPTPEERERWVRAATAVVRALGPTTAYAEAMPRAMPPAEAYHAATARLRRTIGLAELEALARVLAPGWRRIVRQWLGAHALARAERPQRELRRNDGPRVNLMPARSPSDGAGVLKRLKLNPTELMGPIPSGITEEMLNGLAARTSIGGRGKGTWTPAGAMRRLEAWLSAPDPRVAAKADLASETAKKKRRRAARE